MDSRDIFIFLLLIGFSLAQLTNLDKQYIKSHVLNKQSSLTNLFEDSIPSTKAAISILTLLNAEIPNYPLICKELQSEVMNKISPELIDIDSMLKCKFDFKDIGLKETDFEGLQLSSFYDKIQIAHKLSLKLNWKALFNQLEKYVINKKISNQQGTRDFTVLSSAIGIELYGIFYEKVTNSLKQDIKSDIKEIVNVLLLNKQQLSNDINLFTQDDISSFKLNYQIIKSLISINHIYPIGNYQTQMNTMLNYYLKFKHEFHSIENINILLEVFNLLKWIPVPSIANTFYDHVKDKDIELTFYDAFGKEFVVSNATIEYEVIRVQTENNKKEPTKTKNDFDLDDELDETETSTSKQTKNKMRLTDQKSISLPLKNMIQNPGEHALSLSIHYETEKMTQKISKTIISHSTIKIDHIKLSYEQTENKADEKETTIEFTKRSYRTIKITQDSIIRIKAKLTYGDNQYNTIEQLFLRLKHNEIGKTFSSYAHKYNPKDGYYYIGFAMNDQMNMESYNGVYELSLVVSDPSMKNPIIWNFAKIEVTFRKPLDPSMIDSSYKNQQKPKMEPTFTPEQTINKNFFISIVFSCIILSLCGLMTIFLKQSKVNIFNFPREKTKFLYSLLFAILLMIVFYVMVLFWVKLNILQTLGLLLLLSLPGIIIVYKAMNSIRIDI